MERNERKWCIYIHTNKINNKVYIGETCQTLQERWGTNGKRYEKSSPLFWKAIQKYGWDNFSHEVLEDNIESQEEAFEKEKFWINEFNATDDHCGYNLNEGGYGITPEQASVYSKMNWANKEYRESKCKKVICLNNNKIYNSIIEASQDTGINKTGIAKNCNNEHRWAGIDPNTNLPIVWQFYQEGKEYKYEDPTSLDKKFTKIICTATLEIFNSIQEAANKYDINHSDISACCSHTRKTTKGPNSTRLTWEYYDENKTYQKISGEVKGRHTKVICLNTNKIYNSLKEAGEAYHIAPSNVTSCCKGRTKSAGKDPITGEKIIWKYYNEEEDEYDGET